MSALSDTQVKFVLRPFGRQNAEADYHLLRVLANAQVPQDPEGNREWVQNREAFDEAHGVRRHYIAEAAETREPVGYACLEQQAHTPTAYRLYIVFDPRQSPYDELGAFMYGHLLQDAQDVGARTLAFVEYAHDADFLGFLERNGFERVGESLYNGHAIVRLEKRL